jgi:carboxypeptidase T
MFQINGEIHYGWAQLSVEASTATLMGYAYETIPGMPINAGEIAPDFQITTSPTSAIVSPGQSTTSTLTLAPLFGFSGTVALTCKVPSGKGLSCEVSPSSVTLNGNSATATLSINTSPSTPAGTYKISARGTSDTLTHWTTFTLTVQ